jgi:hypothetical protein
VTDPKVVEKVPDEVSVTLTPVNSHGMSVMDVTSLVTMFGGMLSAMEGRILDRMRENSLAATDRWRLHDEQLTRDREAVIGRFTKIELRVEEVGVAVTAHHQAAHEDQLVADARIKPVKGAVAWIWRNRNSILLVVISVLAILGFLGDTLTGLLGSHT